MWFPQTSSVKAKGIQGAGSDKDDQSLRQSTVRRKASPPEAEGHRCKGPKVGDRTPVWERGLKAGECSAQCREISQGGS